MRALVGQRVVRGPDWKWASQDGGAGHLGTVVAVDEKRPPLIAAVRWDAGGALSNYRVGAEGAYDLRTFDNAPSGVRHRGYVCDLCNTTDIAGFRFRCSVCFDSAFDLCTSCYMTDRHDTGHAFYRYTCAEPNRTLLPPRSGSMKMQAFGTLPGASVVRGPDWAYGTQDGGEGTVGRVCAIVDGSGSGAARDSVEVVWADAGPARTYRVGRNGKVDVVCSTSAGGSFYYPDHLPAVGRYESVHSADSVEATTTLSQPSSPSASSTTSLSVEFSVGDVVMCTTTAKSPGPGDASGALKASSEVGLVVRVSPSGEITVDYGGRRPKLTHDPGHLLKVAPFRDSDAVIIVDDEEHLRACLEGQLSDGKPVDVRQVMSRDAVVVRRCVDGCLEVRTNDESLWTLHPSCLIRRSADDTLSDGADSGSQNRQALTDASLTTPSADVSSSVSSSASPSVPAARTSETSRSETEGLRLSAVQSSESSEGAAGRAVAAPSSPAAAAAASDMLSPQMQLLANLTSGMAEFTQSLLSGQGPNVLEQMALQNAIVMQQVSDVRRILERSPTLVNVKIANMTPLLMACFVSNLEIMQMLLEAGANANTSFDSNITPLLACVIRDSPDCIRLLLNHGASTNVVDSQCMTPLQRAIHDGKISCIFAMVEHGCDVNFQNTLGNSAVHDAASSNAAVVGAVLGCPAADLSAKNSDGMNALHIASAAGNCHAVRLILAHARRPDVDERTASGLTALHVAAERGQAKVVELFIAEAKANFEHPVVAAASVGCIGGETPLFLAVAHAHGPVVDVLVRHGANVGAKNAAYDTCLHVLVTKLQLLAGAGARAPSPPQSSMKMLRQLLDAGADVTCKNAKNKSSLDLASNPHIRQLLEQYRAKEQ